MKKSSISYKAGHSSRRLDSFFEEDDDSSSDEE